MLESGGRGETLIELMQGEAWPLVGDYYYVNTPWIVISMICLDELSTYRLELIWFFMCWNQGHFMFIGPKSFDSYHTLKIR